MSILEPLATWLESTWMARMVGGSMWLIASLSAAHVVGYTLVMGSALVANLNWMGLLLPRMSATSANRAASRGILLGLAISVTTGILLVSWKAMAAASNPIFQVKMLLLVSAATLHFAGQRRVSRRASTHARLLKVTGGIGLALWLGLAVAGCAYILLE